MKESIKHICPVCGGYINENPWNGDIPSDEICKQCGIHFGYDDSRPGIFRDGVYHGWRNKWKLDGSGQWNINTEYGETTD